MGAPTDTRAASKALARRLCIDLFSEGRIEALPELVTEDYVNHNRMPGISPGRAGLEEVVRMVREGFPDFRYTVERTLAEGDQVVVHVTAQGTHQGLLFHRFPPTGRHAAWWEMHWFRIRDGLAAEHWGVRDDAGMIRQLGLA
ncbi:MAG TPA: ester cyclase [Gaiellaceae bacterium]|nr:ester cyclase [Gaiellaceae bacterium]